MWWVCVVDTLWLDTLNTLWLDTLWLDTLWLDTLWLDTGFNTCPPSSYTAVVMEKTDVNGPAQHAVWKYMKQEAGGGPIRY